MYQLIKLYFRLFFKNNKGLLIILILLFTSFSTLYKSTSNKNKP